MAILNHICLDFVAIDRHQGLFLSVLRPCVIKVLVLRWRIAILRCYFSLPECFWLTNSQILKDMALGCNSVIENWED